MVNNTMKMTRNLIMNQINGQKNCEETQEEKMG